MNLLRKIKRRNITAILADFTCNLKLKSKKGPNSDSTDEKKKKASKRNQTKFFNGTLKKNNKKSGRRC